MSWCWVTCLITDTQWLVDHIWRAETEKLQKGPNCLTFETLGDQNDEKKLKGPNWNLKIS